MIVMRNGAAYTLKNKADRKLDRMLAMEDFVVEKHHPVYLQL